MCSPREYTINFRRNKDSRRSGKKKIENAANLLESAACKLADAVENECIGLDTSMQQSAGGADCGDKGYCDDVPPKPNQHGRASEW